MGDERSPHVRDRARLPTLDDVLAAPLRVGEPDVHGPLAVFPLFGAPPVLDYVAFADGCARGVVVKELADGASVNDLVVLKPVSCVEHGRWDGARHDEAFSPAPQAAYPSLRRMKNATAHARVAAGLEARAEQGAVWAEVAAKSDRLDVASDTGAMHDIYERRRDALRGFAAAVSLRDGQTGALAAIGGRLEVLDHVSRPDAFATLHRPLVQGYALDALEADAAAPPPSLDAARAFVARLGRARTSEHDGIGAGRDLRLAAPGVTGAGLVAGDELVQLTAFASDDGHGGSAPRARIRRPSRRR
jgi:hypothetical protein